MVSISSHVFHWLPCLEFSYNICHSLTMHIVIHFVSFQKLENLFPSYDNLTHVCNNIVWVNNILQITIIDSKSQTVCNKYGGNSYWLFHHTSVKLFTQSYRHIYVIVPFLYLHSFLANNAYGINPLSHAQSDLLTGVMYLTDWFLSKKWCHHDNGPWHLYSMSAPQHDLVSVVVPIVSLSTPLPGLDTIFNNQWLGTTSSQINQLIHISELKYTLYAMLYMMLFTESGKCISFLPHIPID